MNLKLKKIMVVLPLILMLGLLLAFLLADKWLESSAGRMQLETALADSLGMPVKVRGDFSIRFFPSIGISGTDLMIGQAEGAGPLVQSENFYINIALMPLLDYKLHILAFTASEGIVDTLQFRNLESGSTSDSEPAFELPRIEHLAFTDFRIVVPGSVLWVHNLELEKFHAGTNSPMTFQLSWPYEAAEAVTITGQAAFLVSPGAQQVELGVQELFIDSNTWALSGIVGDVSWSPQQKSLDTNLVWPGAGSGALAVTASLDTEELNGTLALELRIPSASSAATLLAQFVVAEAGIYFPQIEASLLEQQVAGSGCLVTAENTILNLQIAADSIDLDQLSSLFSGGGGDGTDFPLDVNLALSVMQLHAGGAIAHDAKISAGKQPDCSILKE